MPELSRVMPDPPKVLSTRWRLAYLLDLPGNATRCEDGMSDQLKTMIGRLLERSREADGFFQTHIPGLTLMRSSTETLPQFMLYRPSLCLIIQGAKEMSVGGSSIA